MLDALRDLDWAPRSLRKLRRDLDRPCAAAARTGREATGEEIAAARLSPAEYDKALDQVRCLEIGALRQLDAPKPDGGRCSNSASTPTKAPKPASSAPNCGSIWRAALTELPDRERQILALYYEEELTMAEIGEVIGVCESRVSQLRSLAMSRLRGPARVARPDGEALMGKILSQEEIDALLGSAATPQSASGELPPAPASRHHLQLPAPRPGVEGADPLAALPARPLRAECLDVALRLLAHCDRRVIVSVEQFDYSEFLMSLPDPTAFYAISLPPMDGMAALELNPASPSR